MAGPHYFAWCDEETAFAPAMQVEDEPIFELEIGHDEGDFPSLTIEIANPRMGLLGPGRQQWCWVSWDNGVSVVPLFHGRLVGAPERLTDEVVTLLFRAKPSDYEDQKAALAETLKELPYWDPIWVQERADDPDTAWEARTELPHIDRVTLAVTTSSLLEGEDGTIDVSADEHFYDGIEVSYGPQPKRRIHVKGTIEWTQTAAGDLDLTRPLCTVFRGAGSTFSEPIVSSFTAAGLLDDWPQPGDDLGGGWSMAPLSSAVPATWVQAPGYAVRYTDKTDMEVLEGFEETIPFGAGTAGQRMRKFYVGWRNYDVTFLESPIFVEFRLSYTASRKRSEVVSFTVSADVQSILTDPGAAEEETIEFNSTFVDQPVDGPVGSPQDMTMPIGDLRRNAYFPTDRGQSSLQFIMLMARAKLLSSARAVDITFASTWEKLVAISCRKSVTLHDPRLPGGEATGKIKSYRLAADGEGKIEAEATIGCSIGYGVALPAAASGDDVYADNYSVGYTQREGAEVAVIAGQLVYASLAGTYVIDDDGVDLFNVAHSTMVTTLTVTGGPNDQRSAIDGALMVQQDDARIHTTGDVTGTALTNLGDPSGLTTGNLYQISGPGIPSLFTGGTVTTFNYNGTDGGTLSQAATEPQTGAMYTIAAPTDALMTPDPVGALGALPTRVELVLVPVTPPHDFLTEYDVVVSELVVPMGIDLEAA